MKRLDVPFNIVILALPPERLKGFKPVTVLDIFDGSSTDFHEDGLFSVSIFGRIGDERRNRRFSYINVKVPIFHPIIFNTLVKMKRLYGDILSGTGYAKWDSSINDFVKTTPVDEARGTGFEFFLKHWKDIEFKNEGGSSTRMQAIALMKKYKDIALTTNVIIMPAGLRDLEIDEHNRKSEDEINTMYRRLISLSNAITEATVRNDIELLNTPRYQMQLAFNGIFEYVMSLIEGKKKLLLGKWAARNIFNGTRNVITAGDTAVEYLGAKGNPDINTTIIGLYQYLKASLPVTRYLLLKMVESIFTDANVPTLLINKDTLKSEEVLLHDRFFNQWTTNEGIEKILNLFQEESIRNRPMEVDGRYLFLIYKGPDMTFRLLRSIDEVPPTRSKADVTPCTFAELLYLAVYQNANKYPILVTRYPVENAYSIYPSRVHLRVTLEYEKRKLLGQQWDPMSPETDALEFPVRGSAFVNSLIPHPFKLAGLGADHDGDTCSGNIVYSQEAVAEVEDFFQQRRAYVGTTGQISSRTGISTVNLVLANMTGD